MPDDQPRAIKPWAAPPAPPVRQYSFTNWQTNNPTAPPPGDRMDAEYDRANDAITQTITWVETSLNTDGSLRAGTVGQSQLVPGLFDDVAQDIIDEVQPLVDSAQSYASAASGSSSSAQTAANQAASANTAAQGSATAASNSAVLASTAANTASTSANTATTSATNATTAANHASGDAALSQDYADVCEAWAEHMPDTIPPNILAVMGITGDHWSARWWANEASTTVSTALDELNQALNDALDDINQAGDYWLGVLQDQTENAIEGIQSLYLGAFYAPPAADTLGNPIATGAMYFDLTLDAAYVWNGTAWRPLVTPGPAAIVRYVYVATANQTIFTGADRNGNVLVYNHANYQTINVFKAGVLLTPVNDYTEQVNQITLTAPATAGQIVQLEVCTIPQVALNWQTIQLDTSAWTSSGGVLRNAANGASVTPNAPSDVMISADGVWQQGVRDYTIAGNLLTFTTPLAVGARTFGLVIVPTASSSVPVPGLTVLDTSGWVFDGVATSFPLKDGVGTSVSPQTAVNLLVSLNGVWQAATRDYTVSASTVTFVNPPQPASQVFAVAGLPALMTTGVTTTTTTTVTTEAITPAPNGAEPLS